MRKSALITTGILALSFVVSIADITKQGYMDFTSATDIRTALPNLTSPQFAKVIEGNDKGCLAKKSQTKPITFSQIKTLRQLTDPKEIAVLLGNAYCETETGFRWVTESGKELNLKLNKTLDYDFSQTAPQSLTNTKERTPKEADGGVNRLLPPRVSAPSTLTNGKTVKNK